MMEMKVRPSAVVWMTGRDHSLSDTGDYDYDSDFVEMNGKSNPAGGNADVDPYSGRRLNNMAKR